MMYKTCKQCKIVKGVEEFYKNKPSADGRLGVCKICHLEKSRSYYEKNKPKMVIAHAKYREKNKDKINTQTIEWIKNNPSRFRAIQAKRKAAKLNASVSWADNDLIASTYAMARFLTSVTFGEGYHVDHIVPLQNKKVCGLHCEANLQVLRAEDNKKKGNRFEII